MRTIKFRAWENDTKEMFNVAMLVYKNGELYILSGRGGSTYAKDCVLMQFTGLLDKNGKETWDGDIVSDGINAPFTVDSWNWLLMARLSEIEFEVIGNVFENPELIK